MLENCLFNSHTKHTECRDTKFSKVVSSSLLRRYSCCYRCRPLSRFSRPRALDLPRLRTKTHRHTRQQTNTLHVLCNTLWVYNQPDFNVTAPIATTARPVLKSSSSTSFSLSLAARVCVTGESATIDRATRRK